MEYTATQAARAAGMRSRAQLDQWISRGIFTPEHKPAEGEARRFTVTEIIRLATIVELANWGFNTKVGREFTSGGRTWTWQGWIEHTKRLRGFNDEVAYLVLWTGRHRFSDDNARTLGSDGKWRPTEPIDHKGEGGLDVGGKIVGASKIAELASNPEVRQWHAVNLDAIETRVKAALDAVTDEGDD